VFGEEFLIRPESFPTRPEGEPWGEDGVAMDFLGGPYTFTGLNASQKGWMLRQFSSYKTGGSPSRAPAVDTRIYRAASEDFKTIELRGWEYWLDVEYHPEFVRVAGLSFMGLLEWRPELGAALWTCEQKSGRFIEAVENLFRVMVAYRVLEAGGILLHSAALVSDEGACVFPGRSGAGKSTLSRLALERGWQVLSDDLNAVVPWKDAFYVEQVPFGGELGKAARAERAYPLKAICRIRKADHDDLVPIRPVESMGAMLAASPNVNRDPYRSRRAEELLTQIAGTYAAYELTFSLEGGLKGLKGLIEDHESA
jgi:hypothetical protein